MRAYVRAAAVLLPLREQAGRAGAQVTGAVLLCGAGPVETARVYRVRP